MSSPCRFLCNDFLAEFNWNSSISIEVCLLDPHSGLAVTVTNSFGQGLFLLHACVHVLHGR